MNIEHPPASQARALRAGRMSGVHVSKGGMGMIFLCDSNKQILMSRLELKGLGKSTIPGFIWSLKRCLLDNPDMNHLEANQRLQSIGWDDVDLDYHTMQLAIANFEAEQ